MPGSDIRVLGRSRMAAPAADPAMGGAANGAGNSTAGKTNRPLALLTPVHPDYPLAARRDNIEGAVVVRIWVDADGNVSNVQVLRATPPGYFESAAIAAVKQWHYAPAMRHGRPVAAVVAGYTLRFRLLDADE